MNAQQERQAEIDVLMKQYDNPKATNKPVLMINIIRQQLAKNEGLPKWMYHADLAPQHVRNDDQENALRGQGYGLNYVLQSYPAFVFRRNMDPKFEKADPVSGAPGDFIEMRQVKDEAALATLMQQRPPKTAIGTWGKYADLPPAEDGPAEDPKVTIARLQGQLIAAQGGQEIEPRPGKKGKAA